MKKVKIAFAAGFTGTILTGLIAKMPIGNAENIPLCIEGADVAIASGDDTYLTGNCTLNKDFSGNLIVGSNITATLNLNQKNLTSTTGVVLKNLGNLTERSWIFRTIGYGHGPEVWNSIISALKVTGYDGAISIEHEDGLMTSKEGLEKAVAFMKNTLIYENAGNMWWT